jgi:hypothetical protein
LPRLAKTLEYAPLAVRLRTRQPLAVLPTGLDAEEHRRRKEAAIEDGQRVIRDRGSQLLRMLQLVGAAIRPEPDAREQVRAQDHERDNARHRVAALRSLAARLTAEVLTILRRIRHTHAAAVHAVEAQAAPAMGSGAGLRPRRRAPLEQPLHRLTAEPSARLRYGAARDCAAAARQSEIQLAHDVLDRSIAKQRHAEHDPHDLFDWETPSTHCRGARCRQCLLDPRRVDVPAERLELLGLRICGRRREGEIPSHGCSSANGWSRPPPRWKGASCFLSNLDRLRA